MCYKDLSKPLHSLVTNTFLKEAKEKNTTDTVANVPTGLATLISAPTSIIPSVLTTFTCYSTTTFVSDAAAYMLAVQTLVFVTDAAEPSSLAATGAFQTLPKLLTAASKLSQLYGVPGKRPFEITKV
jgi:hypothetical protein